MHILELALATKRKDRFKISEFLADERCTQAVLGVLATTNVGRAVPPRKTKKSAARLRSGKVARMAEEDEGLGREGGGKEVALRRFLAAFPP